jgi:poly-gamma-glutamate capsule biosynthesis protein CapA/YwtB (metallophosphatase superfamily)
VPAKANRSIPGVWLRLAGGGLALLVAVALFWLGFWSFYNPQVMVPEPQSVSVAPVRDDGSGRVLFLGDFAPADAAAALISARGYDLGYQFARTRPLLAGHDAVVANLESPITSSDRPWPLPKKWVYRAHPDLVPEMASAGIDVVGLANNHVYDYGRQGLADTIRHLDRGGIRHLGAGLSEAMARQGLVLETAGGRLGLLAYLQDQIGWRLWSYAFALDTPFLSFPGAARLDLKDLSADISRLRAVSDLVAVFVHWGKNYRPVDQGQISLGRACIDAGADVVIGHHSHQYQPVGLYRGRPVVYSLGNYAFGTIGRASMRYGMAASLRLSGGRLTGLELIPLLTQNRIVGYQPRVPSGKALEPFFDNLIEGSSALGARVTRRGDRARLDVTGARR